MVTRAMQAVVARKNAASGPTVLLRDTFTGAAGDLEAHAPEIGGPWVEADAANGTHFDLDGNGSCGKAAPNLTQSVAYAECGAADIDNSVVFALEPQNAGILCNFADNANYWMLAITGSAEIYEKAGSFFTLRGSGAKGGDFAGESVIVTTAGDTISWACAGTGGSGSYSVASRPNQDATKHGIRIYTAQSGLFDSIEVTG